MGSIVSRLLEELASIRVRLLIVNLLVVAVPIAGLGFARFYERDMLRSLDDDLVNQAPVLRSALLAAAAGPRSGGHRVRGQRAVAVCKGLGSADPPRANGGAERFRGSNAAAGDVA